MKIYQNIIAIILIVGIAAFVVSHSDSLIKSSACFTCKCENGYYGAACDQLQPCFIRKYTVQLDDNAVRSHVLTYDTEGRVTQDVVADVSTTTYSYTGNKIAVKTVYQKGGSYTELVLLNEQKHPTAFYSEDTDAAGKISRDTITCTYDANGFLMGKTHLYDGSIRKNTYAYAGNNRISSVSTRNDSPSYSNQLEYYTNVSNSSVNSSYYYANLGIMSKNMLKKSITINADGSKDIVNYAYQYNQNGAVIKQDENMTSYNEQGDLISRIDYHYTFDIDCMPL
ncbi:MAG: hypothetical protein RI894_1874 [Bacteroidota bacterium]